MPHSPDLARRRHFLQRTGGTLLAGGALSAMGTLGAVAGALGSLTQSGNARAANAPLTLRIGYQKSSTLIVLAKTRGTLAKALAPHNVTLTWHEFTSGLPLLEALNVGSIDFSADVADTVPVFAQAAGARIAYVARETPSPDAEAILVPQNSPIRSLADLKGKRVAVTKGAGVHYLLIAALQSVGLRFTDVQPAYLTPADARAAFASGNVDAWVTWDPFFASVEQQDKVRVLSTARGLAGYQRYYLATPHLRAITTPCCVRSIRPCAKPVSGCAPTLAKRQRNWRRCGGWMLPLSKRQTAGAAMTCSRSCATRLPSSNALPTSSRKPGCCPSVSTPPTPLSGKRPPDIDASRNGDAPDVISPHRAPPLCQAHRGPPTVAKTTRMAGRVRQ